MIVLDSDHLSLPQYPESPKTQRLLNRIDQSQDREFATTVISLEGQLRGWLAIVHQHSDVRGQIHAYERLVKLVEFFGRWNVLHFDHGAAEQFVRLGAAKIRIGTMDLKIASIVLVHDALLVTGNLSDFQKVTELHAENWTL